MKFVVSCCVVSEYVEVSMILVSVESTCPELHAELHAGTCPVFVRSVRSCMISFKLTYLYCTYVK